ncbi:hypothetical protein SteCoe_29157 [Stentor coeruleus]|uniref:Uncharacterized protein n=1 Tax=Stentor coeruleus TaxID=5963 RepID=A0A1R2B6J1_9CILI|nr:hypothetical protein SteCoe_29157 [Stentor coeruleus]
MSIRGKIDQNPKKYYISPKKQFATLRTSIKKYESDLQTFQNAKDIKSPMKKRKRNMKNYKSHGIRSQVSPYGSSNGEDEVIERSASVISSFGSFIKSSLSDSDEFYEKKAENPVLKSARLKFEESFSSDDNKKPGRVYIGRGKESDLGYRKNISPEVNRKHNALTPFLYCTQDHESNRKQSRNLNQELHKQKQLLIKKYQQALEQQRESLEKQFQEELFTIKSQLKDKYKKKQIKDFSAREKEIDNHYKTEIERIQKRHEQQLNSKINEITSEYERGAARTQEELLWLRKQNENIKRQLEDSLAKAQLFKGINRIDSGLSNTTIDQSKQLSEIYKSYNQLQHDYIELKQKQSISLCNMCKAFTQTNTELEGKISRIRAYINKGPTR